MTPSHEGSYGRWKDPAGVTHATSVWHDVEFFVSDTQVIREDVWACLCTFGEYIETTENYFDETSLPTCLHCVTWLHLNYAARP